MNQWAPTSSGIAAKFAMAAAAPEARSSCVATVIRWPLLRFPVRFSRAAKNHSVTSSGLAPDMDPGAAGFHVGRLCRGKELIPRADPLRRYEIAGKARPVAVIVPSQEFDP